MYSVGRGGANRRMSTGQLPAGPVYRPNPMTPVNAPNTGLIGSEEALRGGLDASLAALGGRPISGGSVTASRSGINTNRDLAMAEANRGIESLNPFVEPGQQAHQAQAALTGAMGPDAQAEAYANFRASPGYQYQLDEMERAITRNAAATGGRQGGNVLQALQRNAGGIAAQDFNSYYARLGGVADRGVQGAGMQNALYGTAANAASAAGGQHAGLSGAEVGANASLRGTGINATTALRRDAGRYAFDTGRLLSEGRTNAGSALAGLYNQQGSGLGDIYGSGYGNLSSIISGAGENQYTSDAGRAGVLSNLNTNTASIVAGLPGIPGIQQNPGLARNIGQGRYINHAASNEGWEAMGKMFSTVGGFGGAG